MRGSFAAFRCCLSLTMSLCFVYGCSRHSSSKRTFVKDNSGVQVVTEVPVANSDTKAMMQSLHSQLFPIFRDYFGQTASLAGASLVEQEAAATVLGWAATVRTVNALAGKTSASNANDLMSDCRFNPLLVKEWFGCAVDGVISNSLSSATEISRILDSSAAPVAQVVKDQVAVKMQTLSQSKQGMLGAIIDIAKARARRAELVVRISEQLSAQVGMITLLANREAYLDTPFVADSFFSGRRFIMTNALEYVSSGNPLGIDRVLNLGSSVVKMEVRSGQLVVLVDRQGMYQDGIGTDIIVAAYPIIRSRAVGSETYYQVDFSRPVNNEIRIIPSGIEEPDTLAKELATYLKTGLIVPRVAAVAKPANPELGTGLYFGGQDNALVFDNLVLAVLEKNTQDEEDKVEKGLGKDTVRPTIRMSQGFIALDKSNELFSDRQAISAYVARKFVQDRVNYKSSETDFPYFLSDILSLTTAPGGSPEAGDNRKYDVKVRKFNLDKDIVFVVSANTPAKMVPVVKAGVAAFSHAFSALGKSDVKIYALSQAEFDEATKGVFPAKLNAADPRINMIYWEESQDIGFAWGSTLAHPKSGEIISADIALTGSSWAYEGCMAYMAANWQRSSKEPIVPTKETRAEWVKRCNQAMVNLGIYGVPVASIAQSGPVQPASRAPHENKQLFAEMRSKVHEVVFGEDAAKNSEKFRAPLQRQAKLLKGNRVASPKTNFGGQIASEVRYGRSWQEMLGGTTDMGGLPITSSLVKSPEDAAMALLKTTLVHELGHTFGLRHNFMGSTRYSRFNAESFPLPVSDRSDSMMDYDAYSVDIDLGAMKDYSDPEGAAGLAEFGAYDLVALAGAYGLDSSKLVFERKPMFCSDLDVDIISMCQPHDFGEYRTGNEYGEFLLHKLNRKILALTGLSTMADVIDYNWKSLQATLDEVAMAWIVSQSPWLHEEAEEKMPLAEMLFEPNAWQSQASGNVFTNDYIASFAKKYGLTKLYGLTTPFTLDLERDLPGIDPQIADAVVTVLRTITIDSLSKANKEVVGLRAEVTSRKEDLNIPVIDVRFRDVLLNAFANEIIVPAGTRVLASYPTEGDFAYTYITLQKKMLNHNYNGQLQQLKITDSQGVEREVEALFEGKRDVEELISAINALAYVAPGAREWRDKPAGTEGLSLTRLSEQLSFVDEELASPEANGVYGSALNMLVDAYLAVMDKISGNYSQW